MQLYEYPQMQHRFAKLRHNISPTKVEKTHPDNKIIEHSIYPEKLRFYQIQEKEHKGGFTRSGRATFRIMEIVYEPESRIHDEKITIFIEYNPELIGHVLNAMSEIGFQWGYYSAREYYKKHGKLYFPPNHNKTNETAY
jgi:hypothetical protein